MLDAVLKRMRRKLEIIQMDRKAHNDALYHDMSELLSLMDMLERSLERFDDHKAG